MDNRPSKIELFRYHEGVLSASNNDHDYCEILVTKILPLIRRLEPDLFNAYLEGKRTFINQQRSLEKKALKELIAFFDRLKQLIRNTDLLLNQNIKQLLCCVETMLNFGPRKSDAFEDVELSEPEPIWELKRNKTSGKIFWIKKLIKKQSICRHCRAPAGDHRTYILPSYVWGIHKTLEKLCHELVNLGREDLIRENVILTHIDKYVLVDQKEGNSLQAFSCECGYVYEDQTAQKDAEAKLIPLHKLSSDWCCPICQETRSAFTKYQYPVRRNVSVITAFTFAPSFHDLENLQHSLTQDAIKNNETAIWQAFEILYRVEWASTHQLGQDGLKKNAPPDFLRKKKPSYDDAQTLRTAANLLGLKNLRDEVISLVPAQKRAKYSFFSNRTIIQQNLDKVLRNIYQSDETLVNSCNSPFPLAIELKIEDHRLLRLLVEWIPGIIEVCHLHTYKDDQEDCSRLDFVDELIENPGKMIKIRWHNNEIKNAKEYLRRAGIDGIIQRSFLDEVKAAQAQLKSKRILLQNATDAELKKLRQAIQKLKTSRWEPDIKPQPRKLRI
jgi:rubredoxin